MKKPILLATELEKSFLNPEKIVILKSVSLELHEGQSIAIMGASGEGKSTLLHILGTLEEATSGELIIAGKKQAKSQSAIIRNRHIGFIFQNYNLLSDYTALQNVLMPAFIQGRSIAKGSLAYEKGCELLESVNLLHRKDYLTKLLSGGEKQRVAIARALCNDPEIILADEPSGNLDFSTSRSIHEQLLRCTKELNKGLIVVTHDKDLAALCDTVYTLSDGTLKK